MAARRLAASILVLLVGVDGYRYRVAEVAAADESEVSSEGAYAAEVEEEENPKGGMVLDMRKCPTGELDDVPVETVRILCEDLRQSFFRIAPAITSQVGKQGVWHCGFQAESADGSVLRRYDLGPRMSWWPFDPLAIRIECSEGAELHGKENLQFEYGSDKGLRHVHPRGWNSTNGTNFTFADLQDYIRTHQVVASRYDAHGGNCQHFTIKMYEYLTGSRRCESGVAPPNEDIITTILAGYCLAPITAIHSLIPFVGKTVDKAEFRLRLFEKVKRMLDSHSEVWQDKFGKETPNRCPKPEHH